MRPAASLGFQDTDEADDPGTVPAQVVIPAPGELGRVQSVAVGQGEEEAVIAAEVGDERLHVAAKMEGRLEVSATRRAAPP